MGLVRAPTIQLHISRGDEIKNPSADPLPQRSMRRTRQRLLEKSVEIFALAPFTSVDLSACGHRKYCSKSTM